MPVIAPEMVLSLQAVFLAVMFVSMGLRIKSKYTPHVAVTAVSVAIVLSGFAAVFILAALNGETVTALSSPILFGVHGFLGGLALASGILLVAFWRPHSAVFAARSKVVWRFTMVSWVLAFVLGLLLYAVLHTSLFA